MPFIILSNLIYSTPIFCVCTRLMQQIHNIYRKAIMSTLTHTVLYAIYLIAHTSAHEFRVLAISYKSATYLAP